MLNAYMVYSRGATSVEGAALVFAHSVREARKVGWRSFKGDLADIYIDFAASRLRKEKWLFDEADPTKIAADQPHVVESPKGCGECGFWGQSPIGEDGLCESCREDYARLVDRG